MAAPEMWGESSRFLLGAVLRSHLVYQKPCWQSHTSLLLISCGREPSLWVNRVVAGQTSRWAQEEYFK